MRTTVTLDDELVKKAMKWSGIENKSELLNEALKRMVHRELLKRFLALEGTMPDLKHAERGNRWGREPLPVPVVAEGEGDE